MNIKQIESLLLQEMEDVRGGVSGICKCESGARQSSGDDGICECSKGGAGQKDPDTEIISPPKCVCTTVGGAGQTV